MTQGQSVRVKKWTQLRPEDFNGTSSASLNARRRHTASPEPPAPSSSSLPSSSSSSSPSNSPPASPLSSSSPAHPSYVYHQHVYYQSPPRSSSPSPPRPYSHDYDSTLPSWRDQHDNASSLLLPSPSSSPESSSSRRAFRHTPEDHLYNPYSRPSSSRSRPTRSSPSPSQWNDHSLPSYELHSPPTSPRSPILSSPSRYSKSWKQDVNPLTAAVEEEITVPESQDSVVPSQKMKICNLILN